MEILEVLAPAPFYPTCKKRTIHKEQPCREQTRNPSPNKSRRHHGAGPASVSPSSHAIKAKVKMAPRRVGRRKLQLIISDAQTEREEGKRAPIVQLEGKELIL